jgi:hypothetical protein
MLKRGDNETLSANDIFLSCTMDILDLSTKTHNTTKHDGSYPGQND